MISKTLLKKLPTNKNYIVYDSIHIYIMRKYEGNSFHIKEFGYKETQYIYEKDLEHLLIEARQQNNDELEWHLKNEYIYNGYTNKYKTIAGIGSLSVHANFYGFGDLHFFTEYKDEETVKDLSKFKKIFKVK